MKNIVIAIVVVAVLGAGYFWYSNQSKNTANQNTNQENINMAEDNLPAETEPQVREFTVVGSNFEFSIKEMTVNQGDTVKITFVNNGGFHDLVLDEFNVRTAQLGDGEQETIEFVADQAGTFEYYCSVGEHRSMGMVGNLIVE